METFLILLAVVFILVLLNLFSKLGALRSDFQQFVEHSEAHVRSVESNLESLRREFTQLKQSATIAPAEMPVAQPTPAPAPEPVRPPVPAPVRPVQAELAQTPPIAAMLTHFAPAQASPAAGIPVPPVRPTQQAKPEPVAEPEPQPEPPPSPSLEERLGANWLNKLGIAILVIGLAFFLAFKLQTMGPAGKVSTGLVLSLTLLGGGLWLERKQTYRIFARGGIGGGWALLFFTTYAMHHIEATRILASLTVDLLLMLLVAAGMVLHSLRYKSQTVTGLAFLLAFATVSTSHLQAGSGTVVFSLLASAVLALGLVAVTTVRHWAWLELAGLVGVLANHFLWLSLVLPATLPSGTFPFWSSTILILFYWAIFRAAYLLRVPLDAVEDRISSLTAIVTACGILGLLKYQSAHPEWTFRGLLAMGVIEMVLALWVRRRRHSAFVVLSTVASILLIAAVPYQFHGVSWPILWLFEAHALALCGLRLNEPVFRRLGLLAGFGASLVLAIHDLLPLALHRLESPDSSHHPILAVALGLSALLFWLHGELYPRRWPQLFAELGDIEKLALTLTSWLGLGAAMAALWVALPSEWTPAAWLALVVLLGVAADWKRIVAIALQADILAAIAVAGLYFWAYDAAIPTHYRIPIAAAIALLYVGMRRKTTLENSPAYVAPAYSWAASLLLMGWLWQVVAEDWLILAWAALAFVLFETGRYFRAGFLRWQAYVSSTFAAGLLQFHWIDKSGSAIKFHGWFTPGRADSFAFLAVTVLAYWLQERSRTANESASHRRVGIISGAAATALLALWLPLLVPSWGQAESTSINWAFLASVLLALALAARRFSFQIHSFGVAVGVALYSVSYLTTNSLSTANLPWWQTNLVRLGLASLILLTSLVFAYRLRVLPFNTASVADWLQVALRRPEQWFFFVPFSMMFVTLTVELRSGNITLGWSLLGLGTFVFALLVNERTFRLAGLALLLLSVVKILLMDVWTLPPADRYITLIVMGCALLLVSFLYTRFSKVFRKYL